MACHYCVMGKEPRQEYLYLLLKERGEEVWNGENAVLENMDVILLPIPETAKYMELLWEKLQKNQTVFGCHFPAQMIKEAPSRGIRFIDYMKLEGIAYENAIATAEGAIAEAILMSPVNLQGSYSLITGYGRCGEILASKCIALGSQVTVLERKKQGRSKAKAYGCQAYSFDDSVVFEKYDFVFNTVPCPVIGRDIIEKLPRDVTIIDIASKPGGVDFDSCLQMKRKVKHSLGIPGKYAPKTSALILLEAIDLNI